MPRKKKVIDLENVQDMASEFCTQDEIARDMGFERKLFQRRADLREAYENGKNEAKISLRHLMFKCARQGDKGMMCFLAKNELGYRDAPPENAQEKKESAPKVIDDIGTAVKPEETTDGADSDGESSE